MSSTGIEKAMSSTGICGYENLFKIKNYKNNNPKRKNP